MLGLCSGDAQPASTLHRNISAVFGAAQSLSNQGSRRDPKLTGDETAGCTVSKLPAVSDAEPKMKKPAAGGGWAGSYTKPNSDWEEMPLFPQASLGRRVRRLIRSTAGGGAWLR